MEVEFTGLVEEYSVGIPRVKPARELKRATTLSASSYSKISGVLKIASDPIGLEILGVLQRLEEQSLAELSANLASRRSLPELSHNLALLRYAGLIRSRLDGKINLYRLTDRGSILAKFTDKICLPSHALKPRTPKPRLRPIPAEFLKEATGLIDDPEVWFRTPNPIFENRQPIDLIDTPDEFRLRNRIAAAKLGMFS